MEIFAKLSISILTSLAKSFAKKTYEELQKNVEFKKFLSDNNLIKPKDDYTNLYFFALIRFTEKISNVIILNVFTKESAVKAFIKDDKENDGSFSRELNSILQTDPEICKTPELKNFNQIPESDINCLKAIFSQLRQEIKSPLQNEQSKKNNEILDEVKEIKNLITDSPISESLSIEQSGYNNSNIGVNNGTVNVTYNQSQCILSQSEIIEKFTKASGDLNCHKGYFGGNNNSVVKRGIVDDIELWIASDLKINESSIAVVSGQAGYGKSVVMKQLYNSLREKGVPTLALKSDKLIFDNINDLSIELGFDSQIDDIIRNLLFNNKQVVVVIDQIDALSLSLSSNRKPLDTYNRFIYRLSVLSNVRVIISCRIFDLEYDQSLQQYNNLRKFTVNKLDDNEIRRISTFKILAYNLLNFLKFQFILKFSQIFIKKELGNLLHYKPYTQNIGN
mgnify:CR=1 FL=1